MKAIDPRRMQSHLLRRTQRTDNAISAKDEVIAAIAIMEALWDECIPYSGKYSCLTGNGLLCRETFRKIVFRGMSFCEQVMTHLQFEGKYSTNLEEVQTMTPITAPKIDA